MNTFGEAWRVTTFGESHGPAVGAVIDGCPAGLGLTLSDIQKELARRRPGQSNLTSPRKEEDIARFLSGVHKGRTLGSPIAVIVENTDTRPQDYQFSKTAFRPSHADFTTREKYGDLGISGGGRLSARETIGRVIGGAIAKVFLGERCRDLRIVAFVSQVGTEVLDESENVDAESIEKSPLRTLPGPSEEKMRRLIEVTREEGDSLGGVITAYVDGAPSGLGEPVFHKLSSYLGGACLSIPAAKGFEVGSGFAGTRMRGSEHNDAFYLDKEGKVRTRTNNSGGIQGGISNGERIVLRVGFKPVSTIRRPQTTLTHSGHEVDMAFGGRHDPCVLPRAVPIVEAMLWMSMADLCLRARPHL